MAKKVINIIDRRVYDDSRYLTENLYRNSTGGSRDNIVPLDKADVIDWLEHHDGSDKILVLFPDEVEEA
ncbi:MAG: hypothetical protein WC364_13455 [Eubacteriales bacterium]